MAQPSQPLPSKETGLFRQVVKFYETKQYKKAIKAADQILKKYPDHGETLAMKGLTLNYMDKKEEAYDYVRKGLKADLKSHVCWHVYGLLHRSDNNYLEAIKCYLNALRLDKDNAQILRDLAMLQIQMRDISGFVDTRGRLLQLRSNNRNNWVTLAVAHHLDGNYDTAVQVIGAYESTIGQDESSSASEAYEHSELLMYKAQVLAEGGQAAAALSLLEAQQDKLRDKLGVATGRAGLLLQLGRLQEAEALYRQLLELNPDDSSVHEGLHRCLGITPPDQAQSWQQQQQQQQQNGSSAAAGTATSPSTASSSSSSGLWSAHSGKKRRVLQAYSAADCSKLAALYQQLCEQFPKSLACHRMPLDFLTGEEFVAAADSYVRRFISRGVPSLFSDLKPLYADTAKAAALQELFEGYAAHLRAHGSLPPPLKQASSSSSTSSSSNGPTTTNGSAAAAANGTAASAANNGSSDSDSSSSGEDNPLTWVLHYLSQHYDQLGNTSKALEHSTAALGLAPKVIELLLARAKVLKHAGDTVGAAVAADAARRSDLADRYTNSMAVKALFAAGQMELAEQTALLFTRDGDQLNNLYDMQHMWYEVRSGDAYWAAGQLPKALKKYASVAKHFTDFAEDQFDFHSYCIRKMTLRAYLGLLRLEDRLQHHPFYMRAALGAIRCYLALHDAPAAAAAAEEAAEAQLAALSPEERKREKLRRKKEEKRREKEAEAAAAAAAEAAKQQSSNSAGGASDGGSSNSKGGKKKGSSRPPDPDPDGAKLAATSDPLGEATKFVVTLKQAAPQHLSTQLAAAEVYGRKGKPLLEAAAVKRAVELAGQQHPDVHRAVVKLAQRVAASPSSTPEVQQLVQEVLSGLLGPAKDIQAYVQAYCSQHSSSSSGSSLRQQAAAAEMAALLDPASKAAGIKQLLAATPGSSDGGSSRQQLQDCIEVHKVLLSGPLADAAAAGEWKQRCAQAFGLSSYFGAAGATPAEQLDLNPAHLKQPLPA